MSTIARSMAFVDGVTNFTARISGSISAARESDASASVVSMTEYATSYVS